jgi:hypothetical protein
MHAHEWLLIFIILRVCGQSKNVWTDAAEMQLNHTITGNSIKDVQNGLECVLHKFDYNNSIIIVNSVII